MSRFRNKNCFKCSDQKDVLYRCRFDAIKNWVFLCGECLKEIKISFEESYQYGGTWKGKKK